MTKYLVERSILLILERPQLLQIVTAFVDQGVVKLRRGPTSMIVAFELYELR
jgi:hypothetical protein